MCNEIKCAVQENVQIGCTGNVHKAAVWMMGNNGCMSKTCPKFSLSKVYALSQSNQVYLEH